MQHLNTLSQLVSAASTVAELARTSQSYTFAVSSGTTCYVHVAGGEVRVARQSAPTVEIMALLQAPFGWRLSAEQDDAGVYFVALRRPLVGAMAWGSVLVTLPDDAYLALRLEHTRLCLENLDGVLELPPQTTVLQLAAKSAT